MKRRALSIAAALACAVPLAATAQNQQGGSSQQQSGSSAQQRQTVQPDLVVITLTPVDARTLSKQRQESVFRSLDMNSDGEISMSEAGVNTQLVNGFRRVDRDNDGIIDRQEFANVHVDEGSTSAPARAASGPVQGSASQGGSAAGADSSAGSAAASPSGRLPSRSIEERSRFSIPGEPLSPGESTR